MLEVVLACALGVVALVLVCTCWCCCRPTDHIDAHVRTGEMRRRLWKQYLDSNPNHDVEPEGVRRTTGFVSNSRGMLIFTQLLEPTARAPKALVCVCHGFADNSCWFMLDTARRLCQAGYVVAVMDFEGHGRSDGLSVYVPKFDRLVQDAIDHYANVRRQFPHLKAFVYGESMGGAVALRMHQLQEPNAFAGAVLGAPMAKMAEEMKPPQCVINLLVWLSNYFPKAAITPVPDVIAKAFKEPDKLARVLRNPINFTGKPRLATGRECLNIALHLESTLASITMPFLVMHGTADEVTSPEVSKALHAEAASTDKTLKLYEGYWHALSAGETDARINVVIGDIIEWLDARAGAPAGAGAGAPAGAGAGGAAGAGAVAGDSSATSRLSSSPSPSTPLVADKV